MKYQLRLKGRTAFWWRRPKEFRNARSVMAWANRVFRAGVEIVIYPHPIKHRQTLHHTTQQQRKD